MAIFKTYFELHSLSLLIVGLCFVLMCLICLSNDKEKASLLFLILASIFLFSFAITLDPFLNLWDERFHALVARNMMNHPFVPTLFDDPAVLMSYDRWDRYHIWFHKQPLFLWQIMLSFKVFGVSEYTLRLPSLIASVILTYVAYRSGKILVNYKVGILAGLLICSSNYLFGLVSGYKGMDHNDVSFLFYISLSFWAYIEYHYSHKRHWIFLIGLFSGMAILCKWFVGLLVYFGWFISKCIAKEYSIKKYYDFLGALLVTIFIAAPWQLYGFFRFPKEAIREFQGNAEHFNNVIAGHSGPWYYHLEMVAEIYGVSGALILIPSILILRSKLKDMNLFWFLISSVLVVYIFFSLAQTKMPSFTIIVFMILVLSLATLYNHVLEFIAGRIKYLRKPIFIILTLGIVLANLNIEDLQAKHTTWKNIFPDRDALIHNKTIFQNLVLPEKTVIFNVKGRHYIECMFYTGRSSYNFIPSELQYKDLKEKEYNIAIFNTNTNELPDYLQNDSSIRLITKKLRGYE